MERIGKIFFVLNRAELPRHYGFESAFWYFRSYVALYAKHFLGFVLRFVLPTKIVEQWVLELLWEKRSHYWEFETLLEKLRPYVNYERLRQTARKTWDFSDMPRIAFELSKNIPEVVELTSGMPEEKRLKFLEGCFERKINGEPLQKYVLGNEELVRQDIEILFSALEYAHSLQDIQRLYDGIRLWMDWARMQPLTRHMANRFFRLCREKAALLGGALNDKATKMPYYLEIDIAGP